MKKCLTLASAVLVLAPGRALAQQSVQVTVTIDIPQVLYIAVDNANVTFSSPSESDFNTGWTKAANQTTLTYSGNVPHVVTIAADVASFTGPYAKAASDLEWSTDGSTWNPLSTSPVNVASSAAPGRSTQVVQYRLILDYQKDAPGTYTLPITYSIVAN